MKLTFILLVILVVVGVGGYFGYNVAYAKGETAGYNTGYPVGEETGYISGQADGYSSGKQYGYISGKTDGYSLGKTDGRAEGYSSGKQDGYVLGKDDGYKLGKDDGYKQGYNNGMEVSLGHGYTLRDPTYTEVVAFLRGDKTDENTYIEGTYGVYVCSHFARDVCNNAEERGIRCAFVELRYLETGHAIIAFNTIDGGLVYFEPMTDERAKPVVGKRYYQCVEPKPGYYYPPPSYDDTIRDILVIW